MSNTIVVFMFTLRFMTDSTADGTFFFCTSEFNIDSGRYFPLAFLPMSGIRVFYTNPRWELQTLILAVRQFNPTAEAMKDTRLSVLLETWLNGVLEEFNLSSSQHIFSSTTDGGADVKRLCNVLLPSNWAWCTPHMLNCVLVEVRQCPTFDFGVALAPCMPTLALR